MLERLSTRGLVYLAALLGVAIVLTHAAWASLLEEVDAREEEDDCGCGGAEHDGPRGEMPPKKAKKK